MALTWSGYWLRPWHLTVLRAYCILQSSMISAADGSMASPLASLCISFKRITIRPLFHHLLNQQSGFVLYHKSAVTKSCSVFLPWTIFQSTSTPLPYSRRGSRQKCSKQSTSHRVLTSVSSACHVPDMILW